MPKKDIFGEEIFGENEEVIETESSDENLEDEDIVLIQLGINPLYLKGWHSREGNGVAALTKKGQPRKVFFEYVLDCSSIVELRAIKKDDLTKPLQELLEVQIDNKTTNLKAVETLDIIKEMFEQGVLKVYKDKITEEQLKVLEAL